MGDGSVSWCSFPCPLSARTWSGAANGDGLWVRGELPGRCGHHLPVICGTRHGGYHSYLPGLVMCRGGSGLTITGMRPEGPGAGLLLDRAAELGTIVAAVDGACSGSGSGLLV